MDVIGPKLTIIAATSSESGVTSFRAYQLWSPISALTSSTSEFVGSSLSDIITKTVGALSYIWSASFMGYDKTSDSVSSIFARTPKVDENINVQTGAPVPSTIPVILQKEYNEILSRLKLLEKKLSDHDEKFVIYDANYVRLTEQLTTLELAMKEASSRGKTPEQIIAEIMHMKLGVTSDNEVVTLSNLMTVLSDKSTKESSNLDIKLKEVADKMVLETGRIKESHDQIKVGLEVLQRDQSQMQVKLEETVSKPVEVDLEKLKNSILPVLVSEVATQVKVACETRDCPEYGPAGGGNFMGTQQDLEKLIKMAIAKYDADKTGLPDLALESAGGTVLSTRCTKSSKLRNSVVSFFGFKIWSPPNNPRTIIQPGVVPGECWAFEGSVGDIVIQLIAPSIIQGFTMEHISKSVSPYGHIDSAPYKFEVWGLKAENDFDTMWNYGSFSYEDNNETLQYFPVQNPAAEAYPIVELKILSNHGNLRHTCLYRFRVHGALEMKVSHLHMKTERPEE